MKILKKMSPTTKLFVFAALFGIILGSILGIFDINFNITINEPYRTIITAFQLIAIAYVVYHFFKEFVYTPIKNKRNKKSVSANERTN